MHRILLIFAILSIMNLDHSNLAAKNSAKASFAGGCFWCVESTFSKLHGVQSVVSGYIGGEKINANYEEVSSGNTGHYEAIEITYDPEIISFEKLLDSYWKEIDPTDAQGQFADRGPQYKPAIFYHNEKQKDIATASKKILQEKKLFDKAITVEILPATEFYPAEDYHQDYYKKNPIHYSAYRIGSGRQGFIDKVWSKIKESFAPEKEEITIISLDENEYQKPSDKEIKGKLDDLEYKVTQLCGTEPPFKNKYWNNKEPGIYVDIVTGEPLFSSADKFDSGSGWPSFTKPLVLENVTKHEDNSHSMQRTEVKSQHGQSHLGHVFNDGPAEQGGQRFCINSASLKFIPVADLEKEGYGEFKKSFEKKEQP